MEPLASVESCVRQIAPGRPTLKSFLDYVVGTGLVDERGLERAGRVARAEGRPLDRVLNQLGLLDDDAFARSWAEVTGLPTASEADYPVNPVALDVSTAFLQSAEVVPLKVVDSTLDLAILDPQDVFAVEAISAKTGFHVRLSVGRPKDVASALDRLRSGPQTIDLSHKEHETLSSDVALVRDGVSDAPVIRFVQDLLGHAVERRASDIHLTISREGARIRLRIDGQLTEIPSPPVDLYEAAISRIKIMSGLDIAERRLPQDGSARAVVRGKEVDFRVATMPHMTGEGVVLRILDRSALSWDLEELGVAKSFVASLRTALSEPNGLVLMTGPTGSGKTTTLYAALRSIVREDRNIVTIEDPVEYQLDNRITQIEINARIGFDFPRALRAVLRQDPDVILIGEIRDAETASIAARAALTGHLVLASVHTNTAMAAIPRLIDMGIEPYILAATLRAVMGQRLLRRGCRACSPQPIGHSSGAPACEQCKGSGYSGRIAVTEFFDIDDAFRSELTKTHDLEGLKAIAARRGMRTFMDNALDLIETGLTTRTEVERVLGRDE